MRSLCQMSCIRLHSHCLKGVKYPENDCLHYCIARLPHMVIGLCTHCISGMFKKQRLQMSWKNTPVPTACNCQAIPVHVRFSPNINQSFLAPWSTFPKGFVQIDLYFKISCQRTDRWKGAKTDNKAKISHLWSRGGICRCTVGEMMADLL